MFATVKNGALLISGTLALVCCCGCAVFQCSNNESLWAGRLPDGREVDLWQIQRQDALRHTPDDNYTALLVQVWADGKPTIEREVARRPGTAYKVARFGFGKLEAHTDASGQHVWFIDKSTGQVVASIDAENVKATGPNDPPPPWVDPNAGEPLAPSYSYRCRKSASASLDVPPRDTP